MACVTVGLKRPLEFDSLHTPTRPLKRRRFAAALISSSGSAENCSDVINVTRSNPFAEVKGRFTPDDIAASIRDEVKRLHKRKQLHSSPAEARLSPDNLICDASPPHYAFSLDSPLHSALDSGSATSPNASKDKPIFTMHQVGLICERILKEREAAISSEYNQVLAEKLAEQYETFVKFTYDQIQQKYECAAAPSYVYNCEKMTTKSKEDSRLESEIERGREESDWKRVIELAKLRRAKYSEKDVLASFLLGEGLLEIYLEENAPVEENCATAKKKLAEAKSLLHDASSEPGIALDAKLLLAKVHYAEGNHKEVLALYSQAGLENLSERRLPLRSLRMIAEAYAIRALCTEALPPGSTSKFRGSERQEQVISWYEKASDLALLYIQEASYASENRANAGQVSSSATSDPTASADRSSKAILGLILEKAVQRGPIVLLASGHYQRAVARYRALLTAVEPPTAGASSGGAQRQLRIALLNSFAEVLIRGDSPASYRPPQGTLERTTAKANEYTPWMPKRYKNPNMFVPNDYFEEVILTLSIAEAMAVREAVLSQSPDHTDARQAAFKTAFSVYDLLIMVMSRWREFGVLSEFLERAMKFSFDEPYPWWQFALCLVNVGGSKTLRSVRAMEEVVRMQPNRPLPYLLVGRICLEQLGLHLDGLEWTNKAIERIENDEDDEYYEECLCLRSRAYTLRGIANYVLWKRQTVPEKRKKIKGEAEMAFKEATSADPGDHLPIFYLALLAAQSRKLTEAMKLVKSALSRRNAHQPSLHLLALILSATKEYTESLFLTEATLKEYPTSLPLLYLKATLEEKVRGGEAALMTAKEMLAQWRAVFEDQQQAAVESSGQNSSSPQFNHEDSGLDSLSYSGDTLDKDNASISGSVAVVSQVEVALSEVASSLSSYQPKPGPQGIWMIQVQVWLLTAELYLRMNQHESALNCVTEASVIMPLSHSTLCTRGLVHQARGELQEAKHCFLNAIAMNPFHVRSMEHLGLVYLALGSPRLAEQVLREAVVLDPMDHAVWNALGRVLDNVGEHEAAADCLASALDLESSAPVLPFSTVPLYRVFRTKVMSHPDRYDRERRANRSRSRESRGPRQHDDNEPRHSDDRRRHYDRRHREHGRTSRDEDRGSSRRAREKEEKEEEVQRKKREEEEAKKPKGICLTLKPTAASTGKSQDSSKLLAPKALSVAKAFGDDSDEEDEEMPAEAKMRMKNRGRFTPTSAGPNSYGKTKEGFSDRKALFERDLENKAKRFS
ncbi:unnamed protein product [Notodromas monacha]|uniref:PEST proteolytic signal-containing nuclear protein n=1 Tax=Notodromas monacha TaxID=399045 RepID=A0A7R9BH18_9CRUS|nr:unnamed protein product [Notodromas monacha]CAG0915330.1 unnamed protein product [Notodromas monacha]